LPDIDVYVEQLGARIGGQELLEVRIGNPFLLRSVEPPLSAVNGGLVTDVRRLGKRIAIAVQPDYWLVLHLMVAGRLHWHTQPAPVRSKQVLAAFDFAAGCLTLTEAGSKKRASLYVARGEAGLAGHDPGGLEPLTCTAGEFAAALRRENRTLKRALTSPRTLSGIGNAYSDEILHAARLSPARLTGQLTDAEMQALFAATQSTLMAWRARLREQAGDAFPEKVTAFRPEMAVHGKFGRPCPACDGMFTRCSRNRRAAILQRQPGPSPFQPVA